VFPYDPTRNDPKWIAFQQRFEARFHEPPEQFAALAYDAMNALLESICKAGLNRARIHDALANIESYDGVTGHMAFDPNQKNVAPMYLATVHNGAISYRRQTMEKGPAAAHQATASEQSPQAPIPYARVGEDPVSYAGPHRAEMPAGEVRVVLFGAQAGDVTKSAEMQRALDPASGAGAWKLLPVDSKQNWGAASTQLVHAVMDDHALAIVALDRDAAHLAEQLALKTFVPVIAVSDDKALTSTNVPWIFRLPTGTKPEAVIRLLQAAVRQSGANPEHLRDVLGSGVSLGGVAFRSTGEPVTR
jgi:branched-chain amino acid transport system substrate-binding protein